MPPAPLIMIIVEFLDARREPVLVARIADQQHGCSAGGRRRRSRKQYVVDLEVPILGERNARDLLGTELHEWEGGLTNECGENTDDGRSTGGSRSDRSPDAVAPCEHEASPVDLDVPVDLHLSLQIGDHPR